jgi:site-specific DNA recombinase
MQGADALALNAKLKELEKQKFGIEASIVAMPGAEPLLHPGLANIYRKAVAELHAVVRNPETSSEAFGLIRGFIDAVILMPRGGKLEIELRGDLAAILGLSESGKSEAFSAKEKALQIKMVAGTRNHFQFRP